MKIDIPAHVLFFQYKHPECMVSTAAWETSRMRIRDLWPRCFRMPIIKGARSDQHDRLLDLEERNSDSVFYTMPELHDACEFNCAYGKTRVHRESCFFSPHAIGPLSPHEDHHIAYARTVNHGWLCSEPKRIEALHYGSIEECVLSSLRDEREPPNRRTATRSWCTCPSDRRKIRRLNTSDARRRGRLVRPPEPVHRHCSLPPFAARAVSRCGRSGEARRGHERREPVCRRTPARTPVQET